MFGTNQIVGQKYFKNAPSNSLFVTSMFFTLQGEGPFNGMPALFIRLTKCNLACSFCDTFFDDGDWMTFDEIAVRATSTIRKYWTDKAQEVPQWVEPDSKELIGSFPRVVLVVTGGEPLLQKNLIDFLNYAQFRMRGSMFGNMQIESNGTVNQDVPEHVTLVCSPKCSEKNGVATKYLAPTELILNRADCLKFVMCSPHVSLDKESQTPELSDMFRRAEVGISMNPYSTIPDWAHDWKKRTGKEIFCSPMNIYNSFPQKIKLLHAENKTITMEQRSTVDEIISFWEPGLLNLKDNQTNHEYTAKYCMEHGFRLNLQMHLYASLA
jgi:organic radical activating enzyme